MKSRIENVSSETRVLGTAIISATRVIIGFFLSAIGPTGLIFIIGLGNSGVKSKYSLSNGNIWTLLPWSLGSCQYTWTAILSLSNGISYPSALLIEKPTLGSLLVTVVPIIFVLNCDPGIIFFEEGVAVKSSFSPFPNP